MTHVSTPPEPILEPDLPIVDPHHHLWDRRAEAAKLAGSAHSSDQIIRRSQYYLFDQLLADVASGHNVRATVHVTCESMFRAAGPAHLRPLGETDFVNGVAAMSASGLYGPTRVCAGIVGNADMTLGEAVAEVLEAHLRVAGERFKGIRHRIAWDPDPTLLGAHYRSGEGLLGTHGFRAAVARLGTYGLSYDAWVLEPQLGEVVDLARATPGTAIVLDHVGTPLGTASYAGRRAERFEAWRASMRRLAEAPNVSVKLGGLGMPFPGFAAYNADPPATSLELASEWRPYVESCIEAFGAERCMFESNFPVDASTCSYATIWNAFKRLAAGCSADEKAALFSGTAARVYRLEL
jgi:predicted TIM-barrel fold metal-dependent hydrolase